MALGTRKLTRLLGRNGIDQVLEPYALTFPLGAHYPRRLLGGRWIADLNDRNGGLYVCAVPSTTETCTSRHITQPMGSRPCRSTAEVRVRLGVPGQKEAIDHRLDYSYLEMAVQNSLLIQTSFTLPRQGMMRVH